MNHYFENNLDFKSKKIMIKGTIKNEKYSFYSDYGVFSKNKLDFGTKMLLENLPVEKMSGKILDLGCGYGPIGIYLAINTACEVHMVDINDRALELAKKNVDYNNVKAKVYKSNIYSNIKEKFNYIITNPPIRAGNKILYEFLNSAEKNLSNNGELWFVIRKQQGAKTVLKNISLNYKTEIVAKSKGYYIIKALVID